VVSQLFDRLGRLRLVGEFGEDRGVARLVVVDQQTAVGTSFARGAHLRQGKFAYAVRAAAD
jgi:hypothetical protein